jgi:hypothetical protein
MLVVSGPRVRGAGWGRRQRQRGRGGSVLAEAWTCKAAQVAAAPQVTTKGQVGAATGVQVTPERKLGRAVTEARRQGVPPARRRLVTASVDGSACEDSEEGVPPAAVSVGWKGWTGQEEAAATVLQRAARGRSARFALLGRRQIRARVRLAAREIEERVKREERRGKQRGAVGRAARAEEEDSLERARLVARADVDAEEALRARDEEGWGAALVELKCIVWREWQKDQAAGGLEGGGVGGERSEKERRWRWSRS